MRLGAISFCDQTAYNMRSDDDKMRILNDIEDRFSVRILKKHHDPFNEDTAKIIDGNPFMASVRSNGNPYFLYLTRLNFVETCVFIDKKIQHGYFLPRMIISKLWFDSEIFNDTLLEGEMVRRKDGSWLFLVSDLLVDCGGTLTNFNLIRRLNRAYTILSSHWRKDVMDVCSIQVKKYFKVTNVEDIICNFVTSLDYTCRGIYFKPLFLKFRDILLNFDDSLVKKVIRTKYKESSNFLLLDTIKQDEQGAIATVTTETTVTTITAMNEVTAQVRSDDKSAPSDAVFLVKKTSLPDVYELYKCAADVSRRVYLEACVPNLQTSKRLRAQFLSLGVTDSVPMVCVFHKKFKKWVPTNPCHL